MKKILSSPVVALIITFVLVFASLALNTRIRLGGQCDEITAGLYSGKGGSPCIADGLRSLCTASEKMLTLAGQLGIDVDSLDSDGEYADEDPADLINDIRNALRYEDGSARYLYYLYEALLSKDYAMETALARAALSEADAAAFLEAREEASQARAVVDNDSYNNTVRAFLKKYDRFPTSQIASFSGVSMPKLFA
ncbi:MAG: hypothetical protein J5949_08315 [Oscillospiraceae bacterium]|nr:hypothetical protein [Oscillospiraceae bacterium]